MYGRDDDLFPCDLLNMADKTLLCPKPPCHPSYSGIGYVLLGFIAQSLRKQSWGPLVARVDATKCCRLR
eukprot:COSAG01_NODE_9774_length_2347_cov_70.902580_3_plen_69_part_00